MMKEDKQTREQRRRIERINKEVGQTYDSFTERFAMFMVTCENPDGPEVAHKIKQLDAQWRLYCDRKNLKKEGYVIVKNFCEKAVAQYKAYKEAKEAKEEVPA
jgi:hypothetical protein